MLGVRRARDDGKDPLKFARGEGALAPPQKLRNGVALRENTTTVGRSDGVAKRLRAEPSFSGLDPSADLINSKALLNARPQTKLTPEGKLQLPAMTVRDDDGSAYGWTANDVLTWFINLRKEKNVDDPARYIGMYQYLFVHLDDVKSGHSLMDTQSRSVSALAATVLKEETKKLLDADAKLPPAQQMDVYQFATAIMDKHHSEWVPYAPQSQYAVGSQLEGKKPIVQCGIQGNTQCVNYWQMRGAGQNDKLFFMLAARPKGETGKRYRELLAKLEKYMGGTPLPVSHADHKASWRAEMRNTWTALQTIETKLTKADIEVYYEPWSSARRSGPPEFLFRRLGRGRVYHIGSAIRHAEGKYAASCTSITTIDAVMVPNVVDMEKFNRAVQSLHTIYIDSNDY